MSRHLRARLLAALAVLLTATTCIPLVQGTNWLFELVGVVLLGVGAATLAHRLVGATWASAVYLVAVLLGITWWYALPEAWLGLLPGPESVGRLVELLGQGGVAMAESAAPVPDIPGMRLVAVGGLGLVAWVSDLMAVTLRRPAVAGLPLLAVYCVPAALTPSGLSWWWFVLAGTGYLLLIASDSGDRVSRWGRVVSGRTGRGDDRAPMAATGRRVGAVALAGAVLLPALVPGLGEGLLPGTGPGDGEGDGTITVLNPILSLRDDLTSRSDAPVLQYETTDRSPDPLRVVTTDSFDGDTWEPTYGSVDRDRRAADLMSVPPGLSAEQEVSDATTTITIQSLRYGWLPVPYPPRQVDISGDWLYDPSTLNVVGDGITTEPGLTYTVQHLLVEPTPEVLAAAGAIPADVVARWTTLPADLPPVIGETAREVAGTGDDLEQAGRLQAWFRSGGDFQYSLDAPPENGSSAIADFLTTRRGYCVQFASSMAIMARSLGIPARVAVGFLPGEQQEDGSWLITQRDAHAWPELYFEGAGWMRFEPTPSTRAGTLPQWAAPTVTAPTDAPSLPLPSAAPVQTGAQEGPLEDSPDGGLSLADVGAWLAGVPWRVVLALVLVLLALASPAVSTALVRRRRWRLAREPATRAEAAWTSLRESVGDLGLRVPASATVRQACRQVGDGLEGDAATSLTRIGAAVERARYARPAGTGGLGAGGGGGAGRGGSEPGWGDASVAVLDLDTPPKDIVAQWSATDPMSDRGLRHDVSTVVGAVGASSGAGARWRARLMPESGVNHLRAGLQGVGLAADRWDRALATRVGRGLRRRGGDGDQG